MRIQQNAWRRSTNNARIGFFLIMCILFVFTTFNSAKANGINEMILSLSNKEISIVYTWDIKDDSLVCVMTHPTRTSGGSLQIFKKTEDRFKLIYSFPADVSPFSITQFGGKLVVTWGTAVGFLTYIYDYQDGVIRQLHEDGSYLPPELTYIGAEYRPAVIVPVFEWVKENKESPSVRRPVFANIYILEEKGANLYKRIPWNQRYAPESIRKK